MAADEPKMGQEVKSVLYKQLERRWAPGTSLSLWKEMQQCCSCNCCMRQCFLLSPLGGLQLFSQQFAQGGSDELRAPGYGKPPPKTAADALSMSAVHKKCLCCDSSCTKHHQTDDLSSELLAGSLPHLVSRAALHRSHSGRDCVPVARLGYLTVLLLTERFLLSPSPAGATGARRWLRLWPARQERDANLDLNQLCCFICITSIHRKVAMLFS